jgi:hypothetical protein
MFDRIKIWARTLKRDAYAIYLAARNPNTPWYVKVLATFVAAYAFSPIDLIPDFIPVIGYLDDSGTGNGRVSCQSQRSTAAPARRQGRSDRHHRDLDGRRGSAVLAWAFTLERIHLVSTLSKREVALSKREILAFDLQSCALA